MTDTSLALFQARFANGLLGPAVLDPHELQSAGYAIHARNVRNSLVAALDQTFPVVRELVGADFFAQAAARFAAASPPQIGWLTAYGDGFPGFLRGYDAAAGLPYLADVAALEWARVVATFADDTPVIDLEALASRPPQELMELTIALHPGATLIRSRHPVYLIWIAHQHPGATDLLADISPDAGGEDVLVSRIDDGEVAVARLQQGEGTFLTALVGGATLGQSWSQALAVDPQFDLAVTLGDLAGQHALARP